MRVKVLLISSLICTALYGTEAVSDTVLLSDIEVSVSRVAMPVSKQQLQVSVLDGRLIEQAQVNTPKEVSSLVPNVYMPDYGSAMTSSIYIRGMGSRINEPVMGMVVDGIPLLDKNMYDHVLQDVKRIELLRGPQGSLYGRNSPAGVMEIRTIQPLDLSTRTIRAQATYGTANTIRAQASYYEPVNDKFGVGISGRYARTDGFYTNMFDNNKIDFGQQAGGRMVLDGRPSDEWRVTGNIFADWVRQGAFPYANVSTG